MLYSYVLRWDDGAAPNPFYGFCTLAICKPGIRRIASIGDWVIGTGNVKVGSTKLIYAMRITEKMDFEHYFNDPRFKRKKPRFDNFDNICHLGDNIYKPTSEGFKQLPSVHSNGKEENEMHKSHDLGIKIQNNIVLISDKFYYFGDKFIELPKELHDIIKKNQNHKVISDLEKINEFEKFICQFKTDIHERPNLKISPKKILDTSCIISNKCIDK